MVQLRLVRLRDAFNAQVGLSDHTLGIGVAVAAVALGATLIEKHVTLSRDDGGVDAAFSLEPSELAMLVSESRRAWEGLGRIQYGVLGGERGSLQFRRSLYAVQDISAGDTLTQENIRAIRPGYGMSPSLLDIVMGLKVTIDIRAGTALTWSMLHSESES